MSKLWRICSTRDNEDLCSNPEAQALRQNKHTKKVWLKHDTDSRGIRDLCGSKSKQTKIINTYGTIAVRKLIVPDWRRDHTLQGALEPRSIKTTTAGRTELISMLTGPTELHNTVWRSLQFNSSFVCTDTGYIINSCGMTRVSLRETKGHENRE